jgi:hypothetical protein
MSARARRSQTTEGKRNPDEIAVSPHRRRERHLLMYSLADRSQEGRSTRRLEMHKVGAISCFDAYACFCARIINIFLARLPVKRAIKCLLKLVEILLLVN